MKAATRTIYGGPEVLSISEVAKPMPATNEVLIKVHLTTVNRTDCGVLWGKPFIIRFFTGLTKLRIASTGTDFAGEVAAVGKDVTSFKVGDKVFGFVDDGIGSHAEYFTIPADGSLMTIPKGISYEQTAASAEAAHYAYNFINKVNIKAGDNVMLNGGTGAIGSAALQMLKAIGVTVTATCRTQHIELVKNMGADKVIDYLQEDFTQDDAQYDFVFDAVGKSTYGKCRRLLKPNGVYLSSELGPGAQNPFLALVSPHVKFPLPTDIKRSLGVVKDLLVQGKFQPLIDRRYPLEEIREAFTYVNGGEKVGNVLLKVS